MRRPSYHPCIVDPVRSALSSAYGLFWHGDLEPPTQSSRRPAAMETIHRLSHRSFVISAVRNSNTFRFSQLPPAVSLKNPFEPPARSPAPKLRRRFSNGAVDFRAPLRVSAGWFSGLGAKKKVVLPEIVKAGDPVLHEPASDVPVEEIGSERIQKIIDDMIGVMRKAPGVGLAAPQIGIPLKV